jgi:hypothetical protein
MTRTVLALALSCAALVPALPADAQQARCAPRAQVLDMLEKRFGETRRAIGLTSSSAVMELYASDENGSWTVLVTLPNGMACLVGVGTGFEVLEVPVRGAPA